VSSCPSSSASAAPALIDSNDDITKRSIAERFETGRPTGDREAGERAPTVRSVQGGQRRATMVRLRSRTYDEKWRRDRQRGWFEGQRWSHIVQAVVPLVHLRAATYTLPDKVRTAKATSGEATHALCAPHRQTRHSPAPGASFFLTIVLSLFHSRPA
jgi:hypothetical protein